MESVGNLDARRWFSSFSPKLSSLYSRIYDLDVNDVMKVPSPALPAHRTLHCTVFCLSSFSEKNLLNNSFQWHSVDVGRSPNVPKRWCPITSCSRTLFFGFDIISDCFFGGYLDFKSIHTSHPNLDILKLLEGVDENTKLVMGDFSISFFDIAVITKFIPQQALHPQPGSLSSSSTPHLKTKIPRQKNTECLGRKRLVVFGLQSSEMVHISWYGEALWNNNLVGGFNPSEKY